jgi:uncharacterized protein with von Willebrand factor type A (vWA) domain
MKSYQEYLASARKAVSKKNKSYDARGLNAKKNYSSFWMDDEWDNRSKFSGLGEKNNSSDMVKLIKLSNYRRAVTNFVKIVTQRDIPVNWAGSESYTNGEAITLSTDIKDTNFDVTVGLALHESSHIVLTDFDSLKKLRNGEYESVNALIAKYGSEAGQLVKQMLNWVEDRRIDNYVFSTSPGYKAYYHKLYDHYWNHKDILKGFLAKEYRDEQSVESYFFHVINMINPMFNVKALPGLEEIASVVDLKNIARLKSTDDALEVAVRIVDIIMSNIEAAKQEQQQSQTQTQSEPSGQGGGEMPSQEGTEEQDDEGEGEEDSEELEELSGMDSHAVRRAIQKQKDFLDGKFGKKSATRKLQNQLDNIAKQDIEVQSVGGDGVSSTTALMYDMTDSSKIANYDALCEQLEELQNRMRSMSYGAEYSKLRDEQTNLRNQMNDLGVSDHFGPWSRSEYVDSIQKGIELGGLLGKRLQLHNEARERVDNRLRNGKIDNRRLAHAGYGIDSVFSQIHIDKYKKANLHISLDGSGSMSGNKWASTVQMTMAIAKAAAYTQGINVEVSVRVTNSTGRNGEVPSNIVAYNSRKNKLTHLVSFFKRFSPNSMTPEGLCFEAMINKNLLTAGTSELDSYFLNISDGAPGMQNYGGSGAIAHTAKQVSRLRNQLDMKVISFFIEDSRGSNDSDAYNKMLERFTSSGTGAAFRSMYGKDASVADPNSAMGIARELNKKFLSK